MKTKSFGLVEVVAVRVGVEYVELDAEMGLVAFKMVKTGSVDGLGGEWLDDLVTPMEVQGLAKLEDVLQFEKGLLKNIPKWPMLWMVAPSVMEGLREEGWTTKLMDQLMLERKPFDAVMEGRLGVEDVYQADWCNFVLCDRRGKAMPVARHADYGNGFSDGKLDLEKALEVLKTNPRVVWKRHGREAKPEVQAVPHYNVSRGCASHVEFLFQPSLEEIRQMQKACNGRQLHSCFWELVFELDVLGLRAGGAVRERAGQRGDEVGRGMADKGAEE